MSFLTFVVVAPFVAAYLCSALRLVYYFVQLKRGKLRVLPGSTTGFVLHLLGVVLSLSVPAFISFQTDDGNALAFGTIFATLPLLIIGGIAEASIKTERIGSSRLT
jgi:hypothetical protein